MEFLQNTCCFEAFLFRRCWVLWCHKNVSPAAHLGAISDRSLCAAGSDCCWKPPDEWMIKQIRSTCWESLGGDQQFKAWLGSSTFSGQMCRLAQLKFGPVFFCVSRRCVCAVFHCPLLWEVVAGWTRELWGTFRNYFGSPGRIQLDLYSKKPGWFCLRWSENNSHLHLVTETQD